MKVKYILKIVIEIDENDETPLKDESVKLSIGEIVDLGLIGSSIELNVDLIENPPKNLYVRMQKIDQKHVEALIENYKATGSLATSVFHKDIIVIVSPKGKNCF
jgi:hypothetical protein